MPTILETSQVRGIKLLYWLSVFTATVSGTFCAIFVVVLLYNYHFSYRPQSETTDFAVSDSSIGEIPFFSSDPSYRQPASDTFNLLPTDYKEFLALKRQLTADKTNETLKEKIRILDQNLRLDYFRRREMIMRTTPFLCFAAVVFLIATRTISILKRNIPIPSGNSVSVSRQSDSERLRLGTLTIVGVSTALLGLAFGLILFPASPFENILSAKLSESQQIQNKTLAKTISGNSENSNSEKNKSSATTENAALPVPELPVPALPVPALSDRESFLAELAQNWSSFRGFDGSGIARSSSPPTKWNTKTGENILWQTEVPLSGKSSPVVWKNRLFLSGANEEKRQVYCFDAETGQIVWTVDAPSVTASQQPIRVSEDTGFAAPTMVIDGYRAFALFANGDLVAVDFSGRVLWSKHLGIPESSYGFSASPVLYFDRLIVQYDVGDGTDGKSKLYAFEVNTGNIIWEIPREIPNSWSSPIIKKIADRYQIITCGDPFVIAYDPEDGKEIWRCKCLGGDVGPSPAAQGNVVFVTNQTPRTTAIDASGTGDVTATNILWQGVNALPDTPSPLATEQYFYTLDSGGYLTAYNPATIKNKRAAFWELEIGEGISSFYSSPVLAGNLLYAFDKSEDDPRAFVIDLSKSATDDEGMLTEEAAGAMLLAINPMQEPCVTSPAILNDRIFIRGTKKVYCIENKQSP
ncbi:MAG: PQQ-binding-like beta-propeller repeat protein [Planctomycetaceae bacterium]|jgi:outer membrane protein assembly factor BamB|nr:PQQ-binding-like beta-propeller repeat protein [Planctomycetaceae bacterium]